MKLLHLRLAIAALLFLDFSLSAATFYVDVNGTNPTPPYSDWSTAATNIQNAVDASSDGDLVLVTNGVYQSGGRADEYGISNRVAITKSVTVQSVNGSSVSVIQGDYFRWLLYPYISTGSNVRAVYLTNGAILSGFTLSTSASSSSGGGAFCESTNAFLINCLITSDSAASPAGGVYGGFLINCCVSNNTSSGVFGSVLTNCLVVNNSGSSGGGAVNSTLYNCLVTGNVATWGGGLENCLAWNCTIAGNSSVYGGGTYGGTVNNSSLIENIGSNGGGGAWNCVLNNCAINGNSTYLSTTYGGGGANGGALNNCIVYYNYAPPSTGSNYVNAALNYCCTVPMPTNGVGNITNEPQLASLSHLGANSPCIGAGSTAYISGMDIDGEAWLNPPSIGCNEYHFGAVTGLMTVAIQSDYTNIGLNFIANLTAPICGRTSLSRWIFDDGTFTTNRAFISHRWTTEGIHYALLQAYNDTYPSGIVATQYFQVIKQFYVNVNNTTPVSPYTNWAAAATSIQNAVDVAYPGSIVLVTNGTYQSGGRVVNETTVNRVALLKPLTVSSVNGPSVTIIAGGSNTRCAYLTNSATLSGFTLTGGSASSGATTAHYDRLGGGVYAEDVSEVVSNCILRQNYANYYGGGAWNGTLINCLLTQNSAGSVGGGAYYSSLINCTVVQNSAQQAGGTQQGTLDNCIVYYNSSSPFPQANYNSSVMVNCCTTPNPNGINNITNEPLFIDLGNGDFHLQSNSPCINSGNNSYVTNATDLDGNPRIVGGTVDIGAYEYQSPSSVVSYAYLQQYGLPTDGTADYADSDGDGMNNYAEWKAGTNPTNSASLLELSAPAVTVTNATVTWQSVSGINYFVQRGSDLSAQPIFTTIQSNIVGQAGTTSYNDTTATNSIPYFYRVGVQ